MSSTNAHPGLIHDSCSTCLRFTFRQISDGPRYLRFMWLFGFFFCESSLTDQINFRLQNGTANLLKDQTSYTIPSSASSRTLRKRRRNLNHFFSVPPMTLKHASWMSFIPTSQDLNKQTSLRVMWSGNKPHDILWWLTQTESDFWSIMPPFSFLKWLCFTANFKGHKWMCRFSSL